MLNALLQIIPLAQMAPAQAAPGAKPGFDPTVIIMMVGMVAIFYFMIIRPQSKQQKDRKQMLDSIKAGDKILTTGGIYGQVVSMGKNSIRVRVAKDVELRMTRSAIASKTSKDDKDEE